MVTGHGAIAYSPSTGQSNTSWCWPDRQQAEQRALDGMPADSVTWYGHHAFVALARGPGLYGFGDSRSGAQAMQTALENAGGSAAGIVMLIHTNTGQRDPQSEWAAAQRIAEVKHAIGRGIWRYVITCLWILYVIAIAAVGSKVPIVADLMIAAGIIYAVIRYRQRRRRRRQ